MANLRRVLWHLLGGTRGGPLRIRILLALRERPSNTNQLATLLGVDYKTVQHHLRVLTENRLLWPSGKGYGAVYLFTRDMEESLAEFDAIAAKLRALPAPPPGTAGAGGTGGEAPPGPRGDPGARGGPGEPGSQGGTDD